MNRQKPNRPLIIIAIIICVGIFLFGLFRSEHSVPKTEIIPTKESTEQTTPSAMDTVNQPSAVGPNGETAPSNTENLPEDLKRDLTEPPPPLPEDMERQLKEPPPELPDDLKAQLNAPPAPLPPDMQKQLDSPPPEIPDDIKRAMETPPQPVSIDEVNTPPAEDQGVQNQ